MDKFQKMLLDSLKKLGTSPTAIAKSLEHRKIKGFRSDTAACPLANYLIKEFGVESTDVGNSYVMANGVKIDSPKYVGKFVDLFDEGKFPNLLEEEDK